MTAKDREFEFTKKDFDFLRTISNSRTGIVVSDDKFDMFYARLSRRPKKTWSNRFLSNTVILLMLTILEKKCLSLLMQLQQT